MNKTLVDSHIHLLHTDPDDVKQMLNAIADAGVTDGTLLACSHYPGYGVLQNYLCLWWKKNFSRIRFRAFGSFHESGDPYGQIPYVDQLDALIKMGCDGIKFMHMKPDARKLIGKGLNHPSYDAVLTAMEERQIPVTIHCADPRTFWDPDKADPRDVAMGWFYGDGTYLSYEELYGEVFEMLNKHPKLQVTFAHFFFLSDDMDEAKRVMETYPNVRFDLTPGREMYVNFSEDIEGWRQFFETHSHRILLGTDSENLRCTDKINFVRKVLTYDGEFYDPCFHITVQGLHLSEETVERICSGNFFAFAGTSVRPVDEDLLRKAEKHLARFITGKDLEILKKTRAL